MHSGLNAASWPALSEELNISAVQWGKHWRAESHTAYVLATPPITTPSENVFIQAYVSFHLILFFFGL